MKSIFLSSCLIVFLASCGTKPDATEANLSELSEDKSIGGSAVLKASNGMYVACDGSDNYKLRATRNEIGEWETLTLVDLGEGRFAIKAFNGKFVSADGSMGNILIANRDEVGDWETFEMVSMDADHVAIRTASGTFVTADQSNNGILVADRAEAHEWETFSLVRELP